MTTKSVEFPCGIMKFDSDTKKVAADTRKGTLKVYVNAEGEKHFEWKAADASEPEIDQYIFEGDGSKFRKVQKSSGRVYFWSCDSYEEKFFFWMQGKEADKDDEFCKKVNQVFAYEEGAIEPEPIQPQPVQQNQSAQPSQPQNPAGQSNNNQMSEMARMFQQALQGQNQKKPTPNLNSVITPEYMDEILKDEEAKELLKQHLPESQTDEKGIKDNLKSPQLQQAIDTLDEALNSEEGLTVLMSLGFDPSVFNTSADGTDALLKALDKWGKQQNPQ